MAFGGAFGVDDDGLIDEIPYWMGADYENIWRVVHMEFLNPRRVRYWLEVIP